MSVDGGPPCDVDISTGGRPLPAGASAVVARAPQVRTAAVMKIRIARACLIAGLPIVAGKSWYYSSGQHALISLNTSPAARNRRRAQRSTTERRYRLAEAAADTSPACAAARGPSSIVMTAPGATRASMPAAAI
jgi:hypothetical protein